ncbi:MAG: hypothetical protein Roseis2KO_53820 [Roseivirga sp.]
MKSIIIFGDNTPQVMGKSNRANEISVEDLSVEAKEFYSNMTEVLEGIEPENSEFKLKEIVINAEVSVSGKIGFLGTGVESAMKGSISFKLTKD